MDDPIRQALEQIDFPLEDVRDWLNASACCIVRQDKQNNLRRWARRVLDNAIENPLEYLCHLLKT